MPYKGEALVEFTLDAGRVTDVKVLRSTDPGVAALAVQMVESADCTIEGGLKARGLRLRIPVKVHVPATAR